MIMHPHLARIRLNVRAPVLGSLIVLMVWATSASAQVNLLLNRDYVGKVSETQLMRVIDKGAGLNQVNPRYAHTPLTVIADYRLHKDTKGTMRLIETMLEHGADPDIKDKTGATALTITAAGKHANAEVHNLLL